MCHKKKMEIRQENHDIILSLEFPLLRYYALSTILSL